MTINRQIGMRSFAQARIGFESGAETPRDFLERCIAAIEERDNAVGALVSTDFAAARKAADAAAERYKIGHTLSSIDGIPIGIKDIINTADLPTQMNSNLYAGWQPGWDASCVVALKSCGAIPFTKTVTTEFACGDASKTRNPHDLERTPGGSSSGSAAAVGCGMLPAALGTQTRASIIRPASYCGAFGFKPSYGALNLAGVHPVSASLDHLGVIAASIEDCWLVAANIADQVGGQASPGLVGPLSAPTPLKPARLALIETDGWDEIEDDTKQALQSLLRVLETNGVSIESRATNPDLENFEVLLEGADNCAREITAFELKSPIGSYFDQNCNKLGQAVKDYVSLSRSLDREAHLANLSRKKFLQTRHNALKGRFNAVMTLASSGVAPKGLEGTGSRAFISPWTMIGAPCYSLPLIKIRHLPVGIQLIGFSDRDYELSRIARWMSAHCQMN